MADNFRYTLVKPARLLYSSITQKSAPAGTNAEPRYSGTFGVEKEDFDALIPLMVQAITAETGGFTAPGNYYLACSGGVTAGKRAVATAELKCSNPQLTDDQRFKIREKAAARAELYKDYAGILSAASKFPIELAKLIGGKVTDIPDEEHARATAGKDLFYSGAYVVPAIALKGFRRKKIDDKDGCTAFLQNCLYIGKGAKIAGGGPSNNEVFGNYAGYSDFDPTGDAPTAEDMAPAAVDQF